MGFKRVKVVVTGVGLVMGGIGVFFNPVKLIEWLGNGLVSSLKWVGMSFFIERTLIQIKRRVKKF